MPGSVSHSPTVARTVTVAPTYAPSPTATALLAEISPTPAAGTVSKAPATAEGWYNETYTWEYKKVQWNFNVDISRSSYEFYKNYPRSTSKNYADYALTDEDKPFLDDISAKLKAGGDAYGYTDLDDAMNVISFVQAIDYSEDEAEYTRFPLETLVDRKADCKDKAILAAAILHEMGYDVVLLAYPEHMALGIKSAAVMQGTYYEYDGKRYFYVETTSPGWDIGSVPSDLKGVSPTVYAMSKSPVLETKLKVDGAGTQVHDSYYTVKCTLKNNGPGTAVNLSAHFYALALERDNKIWLPDQYVSVGDYAQGQNGTISATLKVYAGEKTQIYCVITGDNVATTELKTSAFYG